MNIDRVSWKKMFKGGGFALLLAIISTACSDPSFNKVGLPGSLVGQDLGTSANAYRTYVWPITRTNCYDCHASETLGRAPLHADADAAAALKSVYDSLAIDCGNPAASKLVRKLEEQHNCWGDCSENAAEMLVAVESFCEKAGEETNANTIDLIKTAEVAIPDGALETPPVNPNDPETLLPGEFFAMEWDLSKVISPKTPGAKFHLEVQWASDSGFRFVNPRLEASTGVRIKNLHIIVNGIDQPSHNAYHAINEVVIANMHELDCDPNSDERSDDCPRFANWPLPFQKTIEGVPPVVALGFEVIEQADYVPGNGIPGNGGGGGGATPLALQSRNILNNSCYNCHGGAAVRGNFDIPDIVANPSATEAQINAQVGGLPQITAGDGVNSVMIEAIPRMISNQNANISQEEIQILIQWINSL